MKPPRLFDQFGRAIRMRAMLPYDAAGHGRRARNWNPGSDSINAIVAAHGDELRRRSRDVVRRNGYAATACDRYVANIIGTGIVPKSQARKKGFRTASRELWDRWVDEADADGRCDFYGLQGLVVRQCFEAGECFARLRPRLPSDGLSVPFQIQLLEPDFLRNSLNEDLGRGSRIRQGIELDALGRRAAYHFYREHPGERFTIAGVQTTRVPAGEVVQVFEPLRPGQLRGLPRLTPVLARLYEIDQFDDAQMVRQRVAALFAFFFTKTADPSYGAEDDPGDPAAKIETVEPGTGYELQPGEEVQFTDVPDAGPYSEFMKQQLRLVAGPAGLTYEQLSGDMSGVNYSSARVALLEIRRAHEQVQHGVVCFQFNRPVWNRWMADAVLVGSLEAPGDFAKKPWLYQKHKWIPQGWPWVDPEREIKAIVLAIRAGLVTRSQAVGQYGYDAEEIDREMSEDNARADDLGLVYESDGRQKRTSTGASSGGSHDDQPERTAEEEQRRDAAA